MLENTEAGVLVEPGSSSELASAWAELLTSSDRRHAMGVAGRALIKDHGSAEAMTSATARAYERFLHRSGSV